MKCEQCLKEGKKSTITDLGGSKTLIGFRPHYDEDGVKHSHDPNYRSIAYKCSNGHIWGMKSKDKCQCGWPFELSKKIQVRD